jgi:C-terminal processing protease CtpA/Prc
MLQTIDSGGHTMLWTHEVTERSARSAPSLDTMPSQVRVIDTEHGAALLLNMPAIRVTTPATIHAYIETMLRSIAATDGLERSCALVVDLTGQTGGAAWPQMVVLEPLFSPANASRFVDRNNVRWPLTNRKYFESEKERIGQLPPNPLERFRGQKFGVVYASVTASAGEMIGVALQGETGRSRSFGEPTYGLTTGNVGVTMPDNSRLLVTTTRYALGDAPPIRGKLLPDVPASAATAVQQAADWATGQSAACKAQASDR